VIVPLLGVLAALAWGATELANRTARAWFEKDVSMRANLALSGARDALTRDLAAGNRKRLAGVLAELARDDRIMAAAVCAPDLRTLASTGSLHPGQRCADVAVRLADSPGGIERFEQEEGGLVHLTVRPLEDEGTLLGWVVLVHDLSYVERRESAMLRFTAGAFALVALIASFLTVAVRRLAWRSWTRELRTLLVPASTGPARKPPKTFQPLLHDVRQLVSELAAEQGAGVRWSPERLRRVLTEHLQGEGIVLLANREPYVHERAPDGAVQVLHPASGLVTALEPVMRACSGTWVAHGSGGADREVVDRRDRIRVPPGEGSYALRRVWLSEEEERGYYYGFSNEGLWPLCHIAHTRPVFRAQDWRHYQAVNRRFADAVLAEVRGPDPIVLVQDYHFALVPRLIRERLPRATVIGFWHIPWPHAEGFGICPWARELLDGMLGASVVGFHTQLHCNNFVESVDRFLEARIDRERQSIVVGGREALVRAYPISIEWPSRWAATAPPADDCRRDALAELGLPPDGRIGVGVDRLDYTKGVEERLLAVERLLERFPHLVGRFTFVQLGAPSRTLIPEYRQLNERVDALAERVNARFGGGTGGWRAVALLRAHHEPPAIFRWFRAADVCYVSSLHDGMNLVAKEFVSARDDERGVLVLSRFTGAARELTEALLVNPYDLEEASSALAAAIAMPAREQAERMRAMRAFVADLNVYRWAGRMLDDAARLRQKERLTTRLGPGPRAVQERVP
jgi:trehalose 6-phosphate synthase